MSTKYQAVRKVCILLRMCLNETNTFQVLTQTFPKMRFKQNPINLEQFNRKTHQFWGLHTFFITCSSSNVTFSCVFFFAKGGISFKSPTSRIHPQTINTSLEYGPLQKKTTSNPTIFVHGIYIYMYMYMLAYSTKGAWNKSFWYNLHFSY